MLEETPMNKAMNIRILDPACGSGSFLVEALDVMDSYLETQRKQKTKVAQMEFDFFRKVEILSRNIYGVDLDPQAVEICQLNLLLRTLKRRAILPNLTENITCGNSLISGEPLELIKYFDNPDEKRCLNWDKAFPDVMENGGFDVIIGNPPYVRIQTLPKDEVRYFGDKFESAKGSYDIYLLFIEQAYKLLRKGGIAGFILPNKFMVSDYGERLRELLSRERAVWKIVDFGDAQIFGEATTYTMLLFLQKAQNKEVLYVSAANYLKENQSANLDDLETQFIKINHKKFTAKPWSFATSKHSNILERIEEGNVRFGTVVEKIFVGLQTNADKIYILETINNGSTKKDCLKVRSQLTQKEYTLESAVTKPLLKGSLDIRRYHAKPISKYVIFPYKNGKLISPDIFEREYPNTWSYVNEHKKLLESREKGKMKDEKWYGYVYLKNLTLYEKPKILTPSIANKASFTYDEKGEYYFVGSGGGGGGGYGIILKEDFKLSPLYILALLNSRLLDFYLQNISSPFRHGYFAYNKQYVEQLPIKLLNLSNPVEKSRHDELASLAEKMLKLNKELKKTSENTDKWYSLKKEIEQTDNLIDERVYELYGITKKEINIIEVNSFKNIEHGKVE